jgi:hypothetical protein
MLSLACGNLLVLPLEGGRYHDIARRYPGGAVFIDQHERNRNMDDDPAQSVKLAEAFLSGDDYVQNFADRLVDWAWENGRGTGRATRRVISAPAQRLCVSANYPAHNGCANL